MSRAIAAFLSWSVLIPLAPVSRAGEGKGPIRDAARLFSPEASRRATNQILDMQEIQPTQFVLETIDLLPPKEMDRLSNSKNENQTFREIALERAQSAEIRGIYVYIAKISKPRRFLPDEHNLAAVVVWPEELREKFSDYQCEHLRKLFARELKDHPDETLHKAVDYVRKRLETTPAESSWFGWGMIAALIGGLLGLWLLLGLIRMRIHAADSALATGGEDVRHIGFAPGLLGGMFGTMAGYWIYDTFFHSPPANPPSTQPTANDASKPNSVRDPS